MHMKGATSRDQVLQVRHRYTVHVNNVSIFNRPQVFKPVPNLFFIL